MDGLFLVLVERQPAEPMGEDLVDIYTLWPEPHDFSHSGDAVLCSVDVLLGAGISRLDNSDQQGDGIWTTETDINS